MAKRYWPYGRFSTGKQKKGDSTDRQEEKIAAWLIRYKIDNSLVQKTIFDEKRSGFHGRHLRDGGGLAQFLTQIDSGVVRKGDVLLIENIDRLSRLRPSDAQDLVSRITKSGIAIAIIDGNYEITRRGIDSGDGTLYRLIGEIERAHRESKRKSENTARNWDVKRRAAEAGIKTRHSCPAWMRWDEKKKEYVLIPERARCIEDIFGRARSVGSSAIATALNAKPGEYPSFGPAGRWTVPYIQRILKCRAVAGDLELGRHVVDEDGYVQLDDRGRPIVEPSVWVRDYYPRVVSDEVYAEVAKRRGEEAFWTQGAKHGDIPNLFVRRIVCAACLAPMHLRTYRGGNALYKCSSYLHDGRARCAMKKPWNRLEVELLIVGYLAQDLDPATLSGTAERTRLAELRMRSDAIEEEIARMQTRVDNWTEALGSLSGSAQSTITEKINEGYREIERRTAERESLSREFESAFALPSQLGRVQEVIKGLDLADHSDRARIRAALAPIVDEIVIDTRAPRTITVKVVGLPRYATIIAERVGINVGTEREAKLLEAILRTD